MNKTTIILAAVLAVQLGIWAIASNDEHHVEQKEAFLSNDTSEVDFIHISNKDGDVTMERIGAQWKITDPYNYPANSRYTNRMLEKLAELELETLITSSKSKFKDYEVDDSTAAYVEIGKKDGVIDKFYSGKPSKNYTHTYMRRADSDEVWLVSGNPRTPLRRRPKDWRDKKILGLDRTLIERILLKHPKETVELVRTISSPLLDTTLVQADTSWSVIPKRGKPFSPEDRSLNRMMNTFSRMNSTDFRMEGIDEMPDFSKPEFTVEVFLEGGQHVIVDFIQEAPDDEDNTHWLVRKDGDESVIYVIYQSSVKNLRKLPEDLKPKDDEKDA